MSSLPERSPAAETPRHSYSDLFGDQVDESADPPAPEPTAYDDPVEAEPYLPPAARRGPDVPDEADRGVAAARSEETARAVAQATPTRAARPVDTGRLYHSAGADARDTGAIPAIPSVPAASAASGAPAAPTASAAPPSVSAQQPAGAVSTPAASGGPVAFAPGRAEARPASASTRTGSGRGVPAGTVAADRGLTYVGAIVVIGVPTLLVGLAQAIVWNRVGWLTGVVLVLTTVYAALTLRRSDFAAAVVVPPLAFLATTIVAGQFTLPDGQSWLVREGFMIVRTLAEAAPWVLGAAALGALIVLYRRSRGTGSSTGTTGPTRTAG